MKCREPFICSPVWLSKPPAQLISISWVIYNELIWVNSVRFKYRVRFMVIEECWSILLRCIFDIMTRNISIVQWRTHFMNTLSAFCGTLTYISTKYPSKFVITHFSGWKKYLTFTEYHDEWKRIFRRNECAQSWSLLYKLHCSVYCTFLCISIGIFAVISRRDQRPLNQCFPTGTFLS